MKKLILMVIVSMSLGVYAQTGSANGKMNSADGYKSSGSMSDSPKDGYVMKDGKMMMVNNGTFTMMDKDMTLSNGTVLMTNGKYMKKGSGKKMMLKEGEGFDMEGNMMPMNMNGHADGMNSNPNMNSNSDGNMTPNKSMDTTKTKSY